MFLTFLRTLLYLIDGFMPKCPTHGQVFLYQQTGLCRKKPFVSSLTCAQLNVPILTAPYKSSNQQKKNVSDNTQSSQLDKIHVRTDTMYYSQIQYEECSQGLTGDPKTAGCSTNKKEVSKKTWDSLFIKFHGQTLSLTFSSGVIDLLV